MKKAIIIIVFFIAGCTYITPEQDLLTASPQQMVSTFNFNTQSFVGDITVSLENAERRLGTYPGRIYFRSPSNFLIRLYGPFGVQTMEIIFSEGTFFFVKPSQSTGYYLTIPFREVPPVLGQREIKQVQIKNQHIEYLFKEEKGISGLFRFNKETSILTEVLIFSGKRHWIEFSRIQGGLPLRIKLHIPEFEIRIDLKNVRPQKSPPERFIPPSDKQYLPFQSTLTL